MTVQNDVVERIVIFGQYKTGTTALFYKIRNSLPPTTRILFEPREFMPEPGDESRAVLAKVILGDPACEPDPVRYPTFSDFTKKIYIVRDPRDWLVSGTLFLVQQESAIYNDDALLDTVFELLEQKERAPRRVSICRLLDKILTVLPGYSLKTTTEWITCQHRWLWDFEEGLSDHFVLSYEDFVDGRLDALQAYLGVPLTGRAEVDPVHDHVVRSKRYGDWRHWFTPEDVDYFRPVFESYLERYQYAHDWTLSEQPEIRPEHCSGYVRRTVAKKRPLGGWREGTSQKRHD
ncbi:MAG: hypothetical protein EOM20_15705 [Spartobacteria bacterium]|nr:hypothetical protein [Spartobacteria bacterium]